MKMAQYWEAQENRWHDKYIEAEKTINDLEVKVGDQICRIEDLEEYLEEILTEAEECLRDGTTDSSMKIIQKIAQKALGGIDV
jgi:predicted RNase H-like nuclease (RuvC/YqgF family)